MSEQKYIMVDELGIGPCNPAVFNDPERAHGWNELLKIVQSTPTYTPAEIMAGMWVPVTERLPRPGERVLVCLASSIAMEGYLTTLGTWKRHGMTIAGLYGRDVTHWMPLPQPPKEADHG